MEKMLFTGGTGFLGRNIMSKLQQTFEVTTCGLSERNAVRCDLALGLPSLTDHYDIVLHAAGKAHFVPVTAEDDRKFHAVNYEGTVNLCRALEKAGVPKSFIFISTVAVYGRESGEIITESHPLEGTTPYAKSKIKAEEFLRDWCDRHGVILTILRPSLIAGFDPRGNLGDMVAGIKKGFYVNIAGIDVKKSILMAEDIANLIPLVKDKGGVYNVCDSEPTSFGALSQLIARQLGRPKPLSVPFWSAKLLARAGDIIGHKFPINSKRLEKISKSLTFSNAKAVETLGWTPLRVLDNIRIR